MIHVYIYAGLTVLVLGFLWAGFTLPAAQLMSGDFVEYMGTAQTVVRYMTIFINILPILVGLSLIAWGFVKSVEERELGYTQI